MTENPFIKFWLWYYDVLWQYWPIVLVLTIIAVWLIVRRDVTHQRRWDTYKKKRETAKDVKRQFYENNVIHIDPTKVKSLEYDCIHFHVIISDHKLTFTDKETGKKIKRNLYYGETDNTHRADAAARKGLQEVREEPTREH